MRKEDNRNTFDLDNTLVVCNKGLGAEYLLNYIFVETTANVDYRTTMCLYKPFDYTVDLWNDAVSQVEHFALQRNKEISLETLLEFSERRSEYFDAELPDVLAVMCYETLPRGIARNDFYNNVRRLVKLSKKSGVYLMLVVHSAMDVCSIVELFNLRMVTCIDGMDAIYLNSSIDCVEYSADNPTVSIEENRKVYVCSLPKYDYKYLSDFVKVSNVAECELECLDDVILAGKVFKNKGVK